MIQGAFERTLSAASANVPCFDQTMWALQQGIGLLAQVLPTGSLALLEARSTEPMMSIASARPPPVSFDAWSEARTRGVVRALP
jgi:hypothetical protein